MIEAGPARVEVVALSRDVLDGVLIDSEHAPRRHRCDLGVLPLFSDDRPLRGLAGFVDWRTSGALSRLVRSGFCDGVRDEAVLLPGRRTLPAARWVLLGLGAVGGYAAGGSDDAVAHAAARIVDVVSGIGPRDVLLAMPGPAADRAVVESLLRGVAAKLSETASSEAPAVPWWVVASERHVARLRSVLEGPPRAADD